MFRTEYINDAVRYFIASLKIQWNHSIFSYLVFPFIVDTAFIFTVYVDGDKDNNDIDSERKRKRYLHDYTRVLLMVGACCHSEDAVSHHTALDLQAVNKFINPLRDELFGRNKYISAWSIVPATAMVQVLHHGKQVPVCHVKTKPFYWCTGNVKRSSHNMWLNTRRISTLFNSYRGCQQQILTLFFVDCTLPLAKCREQIRWVRVCAMWHHT